MQFVALTLISALLYGASTPIGKALLDTLPPIQLAGLFYLGAALGVLPFSLATKNTFKIHLFDKKNFLRLFGAISLGGIVGPALLLLGLQIASSATVAMWLNLELAATAILGAILFKDHLGFYGWVGVIGTIIASMILSWNEGNIGAYALLLVIGASICWGLDNHLTALIDGITPTQSTFWKGLIAGSVNLFISFAVETPAGNLPFVAGAIIVGIFSYGFSISLYIWAAQNLGATRSQMIFASAPFFGVMLSVILLGEPLSVLQISAALLLIFSILVIFRDRHDHYHTHEAMNHNHSHSHDDQHHDHSHSGDSDSGSHGHWHKHESTSHNHPHWPDVHHRHDH
jgi:drug/metabolite transporter (DMT)-like permease